MTRARLLEYRHLDVFTTERFAGNPLAVFERGDGLDGTSMQAIARELNLSETVFVLPPVRPQNAARLRIFTPRRELAFAGHPTLGTAAALASSGRVSTDSFTFEEGVGDVPISVERGVGPPRFWLTTPPISFGASVPRDACSRALGLDPADLLPAVEPQYISAGTEFLLIALTSPAAVDRCVYDQRHLPPLPGGATAGTFVFAVGGTVDGLPSVYSRMFAPDDGIAEDPATGSATGPLAALIARHALLPGDRARRFVSEQGVKMGRRSLLHVAIEGSGSERAIAIGGCAVDVARGAFTIDGAA